jgi:DNA-binding SARP family transcriptional activator
VTGTGGRLRLALLGPFEARLEGGSALLIRRRKARALLAYLASRPGDLHPREKLSGLLWEDAEPDLGRHALSQTLLALRQDLGACRPIVANGDSLALAPGAVTVDMVEVERMVASRVPETLERAVSIFRGDFLDGLVTGGETFEQWLVTERERWRTRLLDALDQLLTIRMTGGSRALAVDVAIRLLGIDPLREDVRRVLMRLYVEEGHVAAAVRQYQACVTLLHRELDVAPEPETTALYREILDRRLSGAHRQPLARERALPKRTAFVAHDYRLAAAGAVMRSTFQQALELLDAALTVTEHLPSRRQRLEASTEIRLDLEHVLIPLGDVARLRSELRVAEADAVALGDRRLQYWVSARRMSCDVWSDDAEAAVAIGEDIVARVLTDAPLVFTIRCRLAQAYYYLGDFRKAVASATTLATEVPGDLSLAALSHGVLAAVHCRIYLALSLAATGEFGRARDALSESVRLAERAGHDWSLAWSWYATAVCQLQQRHIAMACDSFDHALALERGPDGAPRFFLPRSAPGHAYTLAGRLEEGVRLMEDAAADASILHRRRTIESLARWHLHQGRANEALRCTEDALALARAHKHRGAEVSALHMLARILTRGVETDPAALPRALSACTEALDRAEGLGMWPLVAGCKETLASLWECSGDRERATALRACARQLRDDIGIASLH